MAEIVDSLDEAGLKTMINVELRRRMPRITTDRRIHIQAREHGAWTAEVDGLPSLEARNAIRAVQHRFRLDPAG